MNVMKQTCDVLSKYPTWKQRVEDSLKLPPFGFDYSPSTIEIFDSYGLLVGTAWGHNYQTSRLKDQQCEFLAWYLDGQLAVFLVGSEIVLNRCQLIAEEFEFEGS